MDEEMNGARRFRPLDAAVLGLGFVADMLGTFHSTAVTTYNLVAAHANFKTDQDDFMADAAMEIETLTADGEDEDG